MSNNTKTVAHARRADEANYVDISDIMKWQRTKYIHDDAVVAEKVELVYKPWAEAKGFHKLDTEVKMVEVSKLSDLRDYYNVKESDLKEGVEFPDEDEDDED